MLSVGFRFYLLSYENRFSLFQFGEVLVHFFQCGLHNAALCVILRTQSGGSVCFGIGLEDLKHVLDRGAGVSGSARLAAHIQVQQCLKGRGDIVGDQVDHLTSTAAVVVLEFENVLVVEVKDLGAFFVDVLQVSGSKSEALRVIQNYGNLRLVVYAGGKVRDFIGITGIGQNAARFNATYRIATRDILIFSYIFLPCFSQYIHTSFPSESCYARFLLYSRHQTFSFITI